MSYGRTVEVYGAMPGIAAHGCSGGDMVSLDLGELGIFVWRISLPVAIVCVDSVIIVD